MKIYISLFFMSLFINLVNAENIDSLKNIVHGNFHDTAKVKSYNELGIILNKQGLNDSSILIYDKGIELAHKTNAQKLLAVLYTNKGISYYSKHDLDKCEELIKKAIEINKGLSNYKSTCYAYFIIGTFRINSHEYHKAEEYLLEALRYGDSTKNYEQVLGSIYNNLGLVYGYFDQRAKSIDFKIKAINYKEKAKAQNLPSSIMNLANDYFEMGDFKNAELELLKALELLSTDSSSVKMYCLQELARLYLETNHLVNAFENIINLEQYAVIQDDSVYRAIALGQKGKYYTVQNNFAKANSSFEQALNLLPNWQTKNQKASLLLEYALSLNNQSIINKNINSTKIIEMAQKSLNLNVEMGVRKEQLKALNLLRLHYQKNGDLLKSLYYSDKFINLKDSLTTAEETLMASDLKYKYETEKKELEIDVLNQENEIKAKELEKSAVKAKAQQIIISSIVVGLMVCLLLLVLLFRQSEKRKLANTELEKRNKTINRQNEERELLLKEIHHRVKNNLQVISSLLELQAKKVIDSESEVFKEGQSRVRAMALIHEELYQNENLGQVDFKAYTAKLSRQIQSLFPGTEGVSIRIDGPTLQLDIDTAIPLGLIINELITNAFKYGLEDKGSLIIKFNEIESGHYSVSVTDSGQGLPKDFDMKKSKSLGLRLVRRLAKQLYGNAKYSNIQNSTFEISFKDTLERKKIA